MKPKLTGAILGFSAGALFGAWFLSHYKPGDLPMLPRITILILIAGFVTLLGTIIAYSLERLFHPTEGKAVRRRAVVGLAAILVIGALTMGLGYWICWENSPERQQKRMAQLRADNIAGRQDVVALRIYGEPFDSLSKSKQDRVKVWVAAEDLAERCDQLEERKRFENATSVSKVNP